MVKHAQFWMGCCHVPPECLALHTHLLQAPEVVHTLDGVRGALNDIAKLVASALELLAMELHDCKGVVVEQLDLQKTRDKGTRICAHVHMCMCVCVVWASNLVSNFTVSLLHISVAPESATVTQAQLLIKKLNWIKQISSSSALWLTSTTSTSPTNRMVGSSNKPCSMHVSVVQLIRWCKLQSLQAYEPRQNSGVCKPDPQLFSSVLHVARLRDSQVVRTQREHIQLDYCVSEPQGLAQACKGTPKA